MSYLLSGEKGKMENLNSLPVKDIIQKFENYQQSNLITEIALKSNGAIVEEYVSLTDRQSLFSALSHIKNNHENNPLNHAVYQKLKLSSIPEISDEQIKTIKEITRAFIKSLNSGEIAKITYMNESGTVSSGYVDFTTNENFKISMNEFLSKNNLIQDNVIAIKRKDPDFNIEKKLSMQSLPSKETILENIRNKFANPSDTIKSTQNMKM